MSCGCGKASCSCAAPQLVLLRDEAGLEHSFYIADRIQANAGNYAFLISTEDSLQYALLKVVDDENGRSQMRNIDDEAEWNALQEVLFSQQNA